MTANPANQLTFIVGTEQEAERISDAGYTAFCVGDQYDMFASLVKEADQVAVVLLDSSSEARFLFAAQSVGLRNVLTGNRAAYLDAYKGDRVGDFCASMVRDAETGRSATEIVNRQYLERVGVYGADDTAAALMRGEADREPIPTGIAPLDLELGGGLPSGALVTIGALSSMGKTTFCNQLSDNLAASGRQVLFCTCEQSRYELVSMSISRLVRIKRGYTDSPVTRTEIQSGDRRGSWPPGVRAIVDKAVEEYTREIGPRMHIMEREDQPSALDIRGAAEAIREVYGDAPIVICDYLQLLRPPRERIDERVAANENMTALRKLARDLGTCVVVISALNRANVTSGVTQQAFRESSGIEYSTDLLLGLQPRGLTEDAREEVSTGDSRTASSRQKAKAEEVIEKVRDQDDKDVEIKILKHRGGPVRAQGIPLTFEARSSYFRAVTEDEQANRSRFNGRRKKKGN